LPARLLTLYDITDKIFLAYHLTTFLFLPRQEKSSTIIIFVLRSFPLAPYFFISILIFLLPSCLVSSIKARPFFLEQSTRQKYFENNKIQKKFALL